MSGVLNEFSTVRALCTACGWFRMLGYCGRKDDVRAVIRIDADAAPCNLLRGRVREYPASAGAHQWPPGYRDLSEESYRDGMFAVIRTFDALLEGRRCSRCATLGKLRLDWYTVGGGDPGIARMRQLRGRVS